MAQVVLTGHVEGDVTNQHVRLVLPSGADHNFVARIIEELVRYFGWKNVRRG